MDATIALSQTESVKAVTTCPLLPPPRAGLRPGTCRPLADWLRPSLRTDALRRRAIAGEGA